MLNSKEVEEIREHLERAQNPVFFFDNDLDGLCSFVLLRRYIERGRGISIKSFPALDETYFKRVEELNSDYIFILDKPIVSDGFFERAREKNIPVVWIDHHDVEEKIPEFVDYFNPFLREGKSEPVTYLCYQISKKREDSWLGVVGCIADYFLPDFYSEFLEKYPDFGIDTQDPFEVLYETKIGEVANILSCGLKDTTSNVVRMIHLLNGVKSPSEILEENKKTFSLHKRSKYLNEKYEKILKKAKGVAERSGNLLFFKYGGDLSISGELSNHLVYLYPKKTIVVCYVNGIKANLSLRGKNIKEVFLKAIEGINGATGGGHTDAVGGMMKESDLDTFKKRLDEQLAGSD